MIPVVTSVLECSVVFQSVSVGSREFQSFAVLRKSWDPYFQRATPDRALCFSPARSQSRVICSLGTNTSRGRLTWGVINWGWRHAIYTLSHTHHTLLWIELAVTTLWLQLDSHSFSDSYSHNTPLSTSPHCPIPAFVSLPWSSSTKINTGKTNTVLK